MILLASMKLLGWLMMILVVVALCAWLGGDHEI